MTLKIERTFGARETRIRLSGQLRSEHLGQLKSEIERGGPNVALDLEEVDLVDVDGVRFLNECESADIPVLHCSPYVREWMQRERGQTNAPPEG
jgi:hypothetical protein